MGPAIENNKKTRFRRSAKKLSIEISNTEVESIRGKDVSSKAMALTHFCKRPRNQSKSRCSPFSSHQAALLMASETKTAPSDSMTLSTASVYSIPAPTPGRALQCWLCLGLHAECTLGPEADQDWLIEVRNTSFEAGKAERQHWSPRSRDIQSPATGISTARIFSTVEKSLSTDITVGFLPHASELLGNSETSRSKKFPASLSKRFPPAWNHRDNTIPDTPKSIQPTKKQL